MECQWMRGLDGLGKAKKVDYLTLFKISMQGGY